MTTVSMFEAKTNLSKYVSSVETGEEPFVIIVRNGKPIVCFSVASAWEIPIKNQKFPEKCPYHEEEIPDYCSRAQFEPCVFFF